MNNRKQYEFNYCKAGVSYAEGSSWDAFEADDLVYLGGRIRLMLQQRGSHCGGTGTQGMRMILMMRYLRHADDDG
jgi:hypothetical protein